MTPKTSFFPLMDPSSNDADPHIPTESAMDHPGYGGNREERPPPAQGAPPAALSSQRSSIPGRRRTFPYRLHTLLSDVEANGQTHIIGWQPHGRCFVVRNTDEFVEKLLPRYFNQTKWSSFQRQLNLYSFERIAGGIDRGGYYHRYFLRGEPSLLSSITRTKVKGTKIRVPRDASLDPNFYTQPPVNWPTANPPYLTGLEQLLNPSLSLQMSSLANASMALPQASSATETTAAPAAEEKQSDLALLQNLQMANPQLVANPLSVQNLLITQLGLGTAAAQLPDMERLRQLLGGNDATAAALSAMNTGSATAGTGTSGDAGNLNLSVGSAVPSNVASAIPGSLASLHDDRLRQLLGVETQLSTTNPAVAATQAAGSTVAGSNDNTSTVNQASSLSLQQSVGASISDSLQENRLRQLVGGTTLPTATNPVTTTETTGNTITGYGAADNPNVQSSASDAHSNVAASMPESLRLRPLVGAETASGDDTTSYGGSVNMNVNMGTSAVASMPAASLQESESPPETRQAPPNVMPHGKNDPNEDLKPAAVEKVDLQGRVNNPLDPQPPTRMSEGSWAAPTAAVEAAVEADTTTAVNEQSSQSASDAKPPAEEKDETNVHNVPETTGQSGSGEDLDEPPKDEQEVGKFLDRYLFD